MPADIKNQEHLDHARTRVTASVGDVVAHRGELLTVRWCTIFPKVEDDAYLPGDVRYGFSDEDGSWLKGADVALHACDPDGPAAVGDLVLASHKIINQLRCEPKEARVTIARPKKPPSSPLCVTRDDSDVYVLFASGRRDCMTRDEQAKGALRRATAEDLAQTLARDAALREASHAELHLPKYRPDGYHRLQVRFERKDEAKALGAVFCQRARAWYASPGALLETFEAAGFKVLERNAPGWLKQSGND